MCTLEEFSPTNGFLSRIANKEAWVDITIAAVPVSLLVLFVSWRLWKGALAATSKWARFELFSLSVGAVLLVVIGWLSGLWI